MRAAAKLAGLIDLVVEVRDARVPRATAVAHLHESLRRKASLVLLNRADLAEPDKTAAWLARLRERGSIAFAGVGTSAASLRELRAAIAGRPPRRGRLRVAVVGAPNTGKSSVINALARRKRAQVQNRPGITRQAQWLRVAPNVDMLDTPGVLAPRITDPESAWQLAACGILPESASDPEEIIEQLADWLRRHRPDLAPVADLDAFAHSRGMRRRGGELDRAGAARKLLAAIRAGKLFRVTYERP